MNHKRTAEITEYGASNKPRCNVVLVMDHSISMEGEPMKEMNRAFRAFANKCNSDNRALSRVDFCSISFGDYAVVDNEWGPITNLCENQFVNERTMGCTNYEDAINLALQKVDEKRKRDRTMGIPRSAPIVFLLTDGQPTCDITQSVGEITRRQQEVDGSGHKKFIFTPLFIGPSSSPAVTTLARYGSTVITASPEVYDEVFDFVLHSTEAVSDSMDGGDATVTIPPGLQAIKLN